MNLADFAADPTGNLCNASPDVAPLAPAIRPLIPGRRVAGRARTARVAPGQNAAIHHAVHDARPGDMLVVDGAASERFGHFGDLLAEGCKQRGMTGGVFDCTIRDSRDIGALGFQVFARGFHPEAAAKTDPGDVDIAVTVGGVLVTPGDIDHVDDDGVVVIPARIADEVLDQVADVAALEQEIRARILAGETTFDIFDMGRS